MEPKYHVISTPSSGLDAIEKIEKACQGLDIWKDLTKWPALAGVFKQLHSLCSVKDRNAVCLPPLAARLP